MFKYGRPNVLIGAAFFAVAILAIFVWIPLDSASGLIEKVRGRQSIGDALAPTVACAFVLMGGFLLMLVERGAADQPFISKAQLRFMASMLFVIVLGIIVMRYLGPLTAELANQFRNEPIEYRLLRATGGWKHLGFVVGGFIIFSGMVAIVERGFSRWSILAALVAITVIIGIFDLPFEDLQLPPNGDV